MKQHSVHHGHDHANHIGRNHIFGELMCHFPHAVLSVALSLIGASLLDYFSFGATRVVVQQGSNILFHSLHFMHIIFAATSSLLMFFRYSSSIMRGIFMSSLTSTFFCVLSDVIIPYLGGRMMGTSMSFHLCFIVDWQNAVPFLLLGLINGLVLSKYHDGPSYTTSFHGIHIFISSLASTMYMIAHGMGNWHEHMGLVLVFLVIAVVVPCTMSDIVIPMITAKTGSRR